jgi:hypothetical protein
MVSKPCARKREDAASDLRSQTSWQQERAEEEASVFVPDAISVEVFPPSPVEKAGLARTKKGPRIYELLKITPHRQRLFDCACGEEQTLVDDKDDRRMVARGLSGRNG